MLDIKQTQVDEAQIDGIFQREIPPNGAHRRIDDAFVLLEFALEDPIYLGFVHLSLLYI